MDPSKLSPSSYIDQHAQTQTADQVGDRAKVDELVHLQIV